MITFESFISQECCRRCPLNGKKKVPWEFNNRLPEEFKSIEELTGEVGKCDVVFVGEAPGPVEEERGRPFVHKAGNLLRSTILKVCKENQGFDLLNIMITNACKCKPTDSAGKIRAPKVEEINACRPNLLADIELAKPKLIVALGKTAAIALEVPGANEKLEKIRGQFFDTRFGKVLVTYHPSAILRNNLRNIKTFEHDISLALSYAFREKNGKKEDIDYEKTEYEIKPKVMYTEEELLREFEILEEESRKRKFLLTAIDFETVPFHWEHIPEFDAYIRQLPLSSHLGDIAFASISYCMEKSNKKTIISFSFPVRALSMTERIIEEVKGKIRKLESELIQIAEKIENTLKDEKTKSKTLALYFLYNDFGFSKDFIEEIIEKTGKNVSGVVIRRKLLEVIAAYKRFLTIAESFLKEIKTKFSIREELAVELLKRYLENRKFFHVAQNPQFELTFIKKLFGKEVKLRGTDIFDHLLGYDKHGLEELEKRYIQPLVNSRRVSGYTEKAKSQKEGKSSVEKFAYYNAEDAAKTLLICLEEARILKKLKGTIVSNSYKEVDLNTAIKAGNEFICSVVIPFAVSTHLEGIKLDFSKCVIFAEKIHTILEELTKKVKEILPVESVRDDEFRKRLYELYEGEPIITSKSEKYSTSEEALKHIYKTTKNEKLKKLVLYVHSIKKYEGLLTRYIEKYPFYLNWRTGRIHPWYDVVRTASGRLACKDPNIQQVPREPFTSCPECFVVPIEGKGDRCPLCGRETEVIVDFREVFIPEEGNYFIMADYSQIEMAILAELSRDPDLVDAINKGLDMHSYNASNVYKIPYEEIVAKKDSDEYIKSLRQNAKRVTFAVIYGATEEGIAKREGISKEEAKQIITAFYEKHPKTLEWINKRHNEALIKGVVLVPTGRPRWFTTGNQERDKNSDITPKDIIELTKRRAQNTPIQGFASDINIVTCEILRRKYGVRVIGAIHDSIIAEVEKEKIEEFERVFRQAVEETMLLKDSLRNILKLRLTPEIVENLSVRLRIEMRYGNSWKEVK